MPGPDKEFTGLRELLSCKPRCQHPSLREGERIPQGPLSTVRTVCGSGQQLGRAREDVLLFLFSSQLVF